MSIYRKLRDGRTIFIPVPGEGQCWDDPSFRVWRNVLRNTAHLVEPAPPMPPDVHPLAAALVPQDPPPNEFKRCPAGTASGAEADAVVQDFWEQQQSILKEFGGDPPDQAEVDKQIEERRRKTEEIRQAALSGDAAAQYELADRYCCGHGVKMNGEEAYYWLQKAAEGGVAEAQFSLGRRYSERPEDDTEAVKWLRKAADQNHAYALYDMAVRYEEGRGVPQDDVAALKCLRKAAEQNASFAQYDLAMRYVQGRGVPHDDVEAVKWLRKSAAQGCVKAQEELAKCYQEGIGVTQDLLEAARWRKKAMLE